MADHNERKLISKIRSSVRVIPKPPSEPPPPHSSAHAALKLKHTLRPVSRRHLLKDDKDVETSMTRSPVANSRANGVFRKKRSWKANKVILMNVASIALRQRKIQYRKREAKARLASSKFQDFKEDLEEDCTDDKRSPAEDKHPPPAEDK